MLAIRVVLLSRLATICASAALKVPEPSCAASAPSGVNSGSWNCGVSSSGGMFSTTKSWMPSPESWPMLAPTAPAAPSAAPVICSGVAPGEIAPITSLFPIQIAATGRRPRSTPEAAKLAICCGRSSAKEPGGGWSVSTAVA